MDPREAVRVMDLATLRALLEAEKAAPRRLAAGRLSRLRIVLNAAETIAAHEVLARLAGVPVVRVFSCSEQGGSGHGEV